MATLMSSLIVIVIGADNISVMVGINNGVYAKLTREILLLFY